MNNLIRYIVGATCLMMTMSVQAQQLPLMNHYIYNPYLYNPARTGQNDFGQLSVHFRKEWSDLPESPLTAAISVDAPIHTPKIGHMGLGGMFYVDQMHIITKIGGMGSYAYHIAFEKNKDYRHGLSMGISCGFVHNRFNFQAATVGNPNDNQLLPSMANGTSFDFSGGIDYQWRGLHIGASMLQGLNNGLKFINATDDDIQFINTRHWLFTASYKALIGPKEKKHRFYLEPVFLARYIENVPFQAEGTLLLGVDGIAWLGLGYRSSNNLSATAALTATIGFEVKRQVIFAYSFEAGIDPALGIANTGTQHEFVVAYRFSKKEAKAPPVIPGPNIDSIVQVIETKMDSMDSRIQENTDKNTAQDTKHDDLKKDTDDNRDGVETNRVEIERLKELIKQKPNEFKKVGAVYFEEGKDKLNKEGKANLDAVKKSIDEVKGKTPNQLKIYIRGNASTKGDAKSNMELSMRRATAVRQYLIEQGMSGEGVSIIPMGEDDPTEGYDAGDKIQDRRVDIIFTEVQPVKGRL